MNWDFMDSFCQENPELFVSKVLSRTFKNFIRTYEGKTFTYKSIELDRTIIRWNWQHLELKHEERKIIKSKELDQNINFEKVSELKFKVTGLRQNHQDLGEFRKYLEERNCGSIFKILFNVGWEFKSNDRLQKKSISKMSRAANKIMFILMFS